MAYDTCLKNTSVNRYLAQECMHTFHINGLKTSLAVVLFRTPDIPWKVENRKTIAWFEILFHHSSEKHGQKPAEISGTSKAFDMEGSSCCRSFGNMFVGCTELTLFIQKIWDLSRITHKAGKLGKSNLKCSKDSGPTRQQFDTEEHFHIQIRR